MATITFQQQSQPVPIQIQQQGVQLYPQYIRQPIPLLSVPVKLRQSVYSLSLILLVLGLICIIFGGICFEVLRYGIAIVTGVNIWAGLIGYFNQSQVASVNVNQPNMVMYQTNVAMQQSPISANPQPAFDTQMAYNPGSSMPSTVIMNAQISNTTNPMEKHLFTEPPVYSTTSS
ncbi:uncharacterized protein TRIADDRAFT_56021 [Trichoplax adhaerens]|uniref:Expressed protein n=1 Tax=Trichoplax adhaerens TaxID=10228 RepID=B3RTR7_TRIAD|nr:expressed protein [Trichoplax adhaerens]EDV26182.1 expressed protein [Trichoplax adhaerens]|eukprot:XP_002112215.1 expressed protein [Trichoplax adhaerens]